MIPGEELLFVALGGSGEIGMNVNLYGCRGQWIMVDLGLTFAGPDYPGIDLILPDLEFIENQQERLAGIVLTHGHEDHIGALPYLADELKAPLYATPFTAGLIAGKLEEEGLTGQVKLNVVERGGTRRARPVQGELRRAVALDSRRQRPAHRNAVRQRLPHRRLEDRRNSGDRRRRRDRTSLTEIGDRGVLALVCDSTNVFQDKPSGSEESVHEGLLAQVMMANGRVLVTTFASNAARLQTIGRVARRDRAAGCASPAARSTASCAWPRRPAICRISRRRSVSTKRCACRKSEVLIIATGGQGEPRAALGRIASGTHELKLGEGDTVIFSSRIIPGNEVAIGRIMNQLSDLGVQIVTEKQAHVHVSGHPGRPELIQMYKWVRPEIVVPVHGEARHLAEHARLALGHGVAHAVVQKNGDVIRLAPGEPKKVDEVRVGRLVLDGDVILPADGATVNERRRIGYGGLITVARAGRRRRQACRQRR